MVVAVTIIVDGGCCVSCTMMVVAVYVIWAFSCAFRHFRSLKEGSRRRCRNKIKTSD